MNMRRKSQQQGGYNNQHRRNRHGGHGGGHQGNSQNRPRKNYPALREKYLTQARDALAAGDRVLAENYYQHADHCFRMMMEEGYRPHQPQDNQPQQQDGQAKPEAAAAEETIPVNTNVLPAFLTVNYDGGAPAPVDPATVQNWEDRDA